MYGTERMRKGPWYVRHLVSLHGTRYDVDLEHEGKLAEELRRGRDRISEWLRSRGK